MSLHLAECLTLVLSELLTLPLPSPSSASMRTGRITEMRISHAPKDLKRTSWCFHDDYLTRYSLCVSRDDSGRCVPVVMFLWFPWKHFSIKVGKIPTGSCTFICTLIKAIFPVTFFMCVVYVVCACLYTYLYSLVFEAVFHRNCSTLIG